MISVPRRFGDIWVSSEVYRLTSLAVYPQDVLTTENIIVKSLQLKAISPKDIVLLNYDYSPISENQISSVLRALSHESSNGANIFPIKDKDGKLLFLQFSKISSTFCFHVLYPNSTGYYHTNQNLWLN